MAKRSIARKGASRPKPNDITPPLDVRSAAEQVAEAYQRHRASPLWRKMKTAGDYPVPVGLYDACAQLVEALSVKPALPDNWREAARAEDALNVGLDRIYALADLLTSLDESCALFDGTIATTGTLLGDLARDAMKARDVLVKQGGRTNG